jgi:hypothetical protein
MKFINWLLSFFGFKKPFQYSPPSVAELKAMNRPDPDADPVEVIWQPETIIEKVMRLGKPQRYDEVQRARKLQRKGAR